MSTPETAEPQLDPIIEQQKGAAISKFENGAIPDLLSKEALDGIRKDLGIGRVPPVFHALTGGTGRVAATQKLSAEPATAGSFFFGGKPFDVGGNARRFNLEDETLITAEGAAADEIQDGTPLPWKSVPDVANAAAELVNEKAVMAGGGIEVTKVLTLFDLGEKPLQSGTLGAPLKESLLTRQQSRGVVARCFNHLWKDGCTAAVVGSPGIGKSWTILCALQQALLCEDATVILQASSAGVRYPLIRRTSRIFAWSMTCDGNSMATTSLFHLDTTLVLYDPPQVEKNGKGGANFAQGNRRLVAFLSANEGHSLKKLLKLSASLKKYLAHPSTKELEFMLPYLSSSPHEEGAREFRDRMTKVGNLPRYLLEKTAYEKRLEQLENAVGKDDQYFLRALLSGGEATVTMESSDTLPGTLLTVSPLWRFLEPEENTNDEGQIANDDSGGTKTPETAKASADEEGAASGADPSNQAKQSPAEMELDDDSNQKPAAATHLPAEAAGDGGPSSVEMETDGVTGVDIQDLEGDELAASLREPEDCDGGHYDYDEKVVSVLTEQVLAKILRASREVILSYWGVIDSAEFARMGGAVEKLFIADLLRGPGSFKRCRLGQTNCDELRIGELEELGLQGRPEKDAFQELQGVFSENKNVIVRLTDGFALIDCAGPGRRVYQVTVGHDHSMSVGGMRKLLVAADF